MSDSSRPLSPFPYPGGKTNYVDDILQYVPDHKRYVEPFGGSASVLLNKPESYIEVYNDLDNDVVHFFETVRERREELAEWLRHVPFSIDLYREWAREHFVDGYRPDDDLERAGRWFYLRYTQYGGKTGRRSGFKRSGKRNEARSFRGGIDALEAVVDRLQEVTIECADYAEVIERYDGDDAFYYLDPPYVEAKPSYYSGEEFTHRRLVETLAETEGRWICSYRELPSAFHDRELFDRDDLHVRPLEVSYSLAHLEDGREAATERLVMNYDPDTTASFVDASTRQVTLPDGGSE